MAKVELTIRVAGEECCRELKNGLVALVCGNRELRVGMERVMGNSVRGTEGEILLRLWIERVKASG